ncbi:hypothetical protein Tsubulata_046436 [Turnera subulata]|uniref:F-box domain-containing protein n=1 Tax=Turnera subulata TaxID=218843 RepID=A0A9Q0FDP9_9ROSI|nr:hypothetical protein Tsubulata_046436 [Turnera subulata]
MAAAANLRLPSEIVEALLAMLPNKSIHRFRSLSKSWSSLLVSEEFQKLRFKSAPRELFVQNLLHSSPVGYKADYVMPLESFDYRGEEETPTEILKVCRVTWTVLMVSDMIRLPMITRRLQDIVEGDRGLFLNGALHWRKQYAPKIFGRRNLFTS